jgi:hypothetical protein
VVTMERAAAHEADRRRKKFVDCTIFCCLLTLQQKPSIEPAAATATRHHLLAYANVYVKIP